MIYFTNGFLTATDLLLNMDKATFSAVEATLSSTTIALICAMLLGLPLAIRTSRRETSVGLFLSVILAGAFFLSIILCESLDSRPHLYPQYLLWLPNIVFQVLGAILTVRISKR